MNINDEPLKSDNNVNKGGFIANLIPEKDECLLNNGGCHQVWMILRSMINELI